jgi:hypothetical protein
MKNEAIFSKIDSQPNTVPQVKNETAEYAGLSEKEIAALGTGVYKRYCDLERLINACARGIKLAGERVEEGYNEAGNVEEFFVEHVTNPSEVDEAVTEAIEEAQKIEKAMNRKSPVLDSILEDLTREADEMSEKMPFLNEMWNKNDIIKYRDLGFDVETPEKELAKNLEQLIAEKQMAQRSALSTGKKMTG